MNRRSKKRIEIDRQAEIIRGGWTAWWDKSYGVCMLCLWKPGTRWPHEAWYSDGLETHEIARGSNRSKAILEPSTFLRACRFCHQEKLDSMPFAQQLAYKMIRDPIHYDRSRVMVILDRADTAVTQDEVDAAVELLGLS